MVTEGFKFQLSSKVGDHMLNVRADDADEFRSKIEELFGEGASVEVLAPFFVSAALSGSSRDTTPATAPTASTPVSNTALTGAEAPVTTTYARPPGDPLGPGSQCPSCGRGQLRERNGKFGPFVGCNAYPNCNYIVKDKR
jgi:hypothetical protein